MTKRLYAIGVFILLALNIFGQVNFEIKTTMGIMRGILYDNTPMHTENFIELAKKHHYDGVLFHRVIENFMIQAGDPDSKEAIPNKMYGSGDVGYKIPPEFNPQYIHKKGALAAARQPDNINPGKESSGSQFYIVEGQVFTDEQLNAFEKKDIRLPFSEHDRNIYTTLGGTPHLDFNYTVFGEITSGFDVLDSIAAVETDKYDRPLNNVKIISITIK